MKKIFYASPFFIVIAIGVLVFGRIPTYPIRGDVVEVKITYRSYKSVERNYLLNGKEIEELKKVTSPVWVNPYPIGSSDGIPYWLIIITISEREQRRVYIDQEEFNGSTNPPEKLLELLKEKYS